MDRMQIALKLGMDALGVQVNRENYRAICYLAYLARLEGVHLTNLPLILKDDRTVYSPRTHESSGMLPESLYDDVCEIEHSVALGFDESKGWSLDKKSLDKLIKLKGFVV